MYKKSNTYRLCKIVLFHDFIKMKSISVIHLESIWCDIFCFHSLEPQQWHPHFFVLTPTRMFWTKETNQNEEEEEQDDNTPAIEVTRGK